MEGAVLAAQALLPVQTSREQNTSQQGLAVLPSKNSGRSKNLCGSARLHLVRIVSHIEAGERLPGTPAIDFDAQHGGGLVTGGAQDGKRR